MDAKKSVRLIEISGNIRAPEKFITKTFSVLKKYEICFSFIVNSSFQNFYSTILV